MNLVVELGPEADEGGIGDVNEEEEKDGDAGDAVERPRPLALTALVNRSRATREDAPRFAFLSLRTSVGEPGKWLLAPRCRVAEGLL